MSEATTETSSFTCRPGCRLDFQWGLGREVLLADIDESSQEQTAEGNFGTAQWSVMAQSPFRMPAWLSQTSLVLQGSAFFCPKTSGLRHHEAL